jgi:alpha-amylase/alpha-mannosidase (GH57 family)
MERYICIHGHFYQPPRENPWLEEVELQDSAHPYHDWNERVAAECYAPNTASRIMDPENRIIDLVNNYSKISFNIGPTLCAWMERHRPDVLEAIVQADKASKERFSGHGSAIAQVYNHMIMPLANRRDKYTQASWGIADFGKRFGRFPQGMWLPETAVDIETLEVLADLNMKFTILAPRQAKRIKNLATDEDWVEVGERIDPTTAYVCNLPSGKSINIFFYDGPISQDMAFGDLLQHGERFADRLVSAFSESRTRPQLVHVATDGESYGHHSKFGDMALAYCLYRIESAQQAQLTNYGEYLEKHPPAYAVEIQENSSWSCIHGIERWRDNCGCNSGRQGWTQAWRRPLRNALDGLRDEIAGVYEREASNYLTDPWKARDEYIEVVQDRSLENVKRFLARRASHELSHDDIVRVLRLLEIQRNCMLMYTSCGWFFDEISGIETTQVLRYAAKAIQDVEPIVGRSIEPEFLEKLALAPSNVLKNGGEAYTLYVKPSSVNLLRVGVHYGISSLFTEYPQVTRLFCYSVEKEFFKKLGNGKLRTTVGKIRVESTIDREETVVAFAVIRFGDYNLIGGVRFFMNAEAFTAMEKELIGAFDKGDITEYLRLMLNRFGPNTYSLSHLFKDEQRQILREILGDTIQLANISLRTLYENSYAVMTFLRSLQHPIPPSLVIPAQIVVGDQLSNLFDSPNLDLEKIGTLAQQIERFSLNLQLSEEIPYKVSQWITERVDFLAAHPLDVQILEEIVRSLAALISLRLDLNLWKAQNTYFALCKTVYPDQAQKAREGDLSAQRWIKLFLDVGAHVRVKVQ